METKCAQCGVSYSKHHKVVSHEFVVPSGYEEGIPPRWRVVDTDNHGSDWPNEKFVGPSLPTEALANTVAACFNEDVSDLSPRFYKVVELPYVLQPGFEP